ncbi:hypothetical protein [Rhodanobacter lindaniclasticus]
MPRRRRPVVGHRCTPRGATPDSPLGEALWRLVDAYTETLAQLLSVPDSGTRTFANDLSWYAWENDWGRKHAVAGVDGDMRPISTPTDLAWLITRGWESADASS